MYIPPIGIVIIVLVFLFLLTDLASHWRRIKRLKNVLYKNLKEDEPTRDPKEKEETESGDAEGS